MQIQKLCSYTAAHMRFSSDNMTTVKTNSPKSQSLRTSSELMRRFSGLMSDGEMKTKGIQSHKGVKITISC